MAKYLSGRQRTLKVGIESYTNSQLSLEVFGSTNISDNLNVTGSAEFNNGISVSGITTFANDINIVGITTLSTLNVTDVVTGVTTFDNINTLGVVTSSLFVGNLTGTATSAGFATTSTYSLYSLYSSNSGVATYSSVAGVATFATNAGIASTALFAYGLVGEYVNNAGVATYASIAGIATYASSAGVATYSSVAGLATYATSAGLATYATSAGVATYATSAGVATYSGFSGIATYANVSGVATYATTAGFATNAGIASTALFAFSVIGGFVANSGVATYASIAGIATYSSVAGLATYSTNAGVSTYATSAGVATNSNNVQITNDVSTNSVHYLNFTSDITGYNPVKVSGTNLTFNPSTSNLGIGTDNPRSKLNVIGNVNVVGLVTATRFVGSAASLTSLTDAVAGVYGNGANAPQITVDATGRITSITQVAITTTGAGAGSLQGIYVYDDYNFLGFSSNISFRQGLLPVSIGNTIYVDALDSIQYWVKNYAGIHTSSNVGIGTTLPTSTLTVFGDGFFTNDVVATTFVGKFTGNLTGIASTAITAYNVFGGFVANAGVATYASIAGVATYATSAGIATYSSVAGLATYATSAGIATYSSVAGLATYATSAGLATYATSAGVATYATSSGIATYATSAGVATYSSNSGIATFATNAGIASTALVALSVFGGFVTNSGFATYASIAGVATYATTAGFATNAGIASTAIFALNVIGGYVSNAGVATYANTSGIATYASSAGIATYATSAGVATYATSAGIATYASTAGIATVSQGLTGTPNIVVGFATVNNTLNVGAGGTVISTTLAGSVGVGSTNPVSKFAVNGNATVHGSVTATSYIGSASSLTSLTGAVAGVYGNGANAPQITVDSTGRITSITQVAITTTGAGSALLNGVNVYDDNGFIGFSSNINAGNNIGAVSIGNTITLNSIVHWDVTSAGINTLSNVGIGTTNPKTALTVSGVTSTSQLYVTGLSTFAQPITVTGNQYSIFNNGLIVQGTAVSDLDGNNFAVQLQNGLQVTDGSFIRAHITSSGNILGVGLTIFGTTFTNQLSVSGVSTFNGRINASAGGILFDTSSYTGSDEPIKLWVGNSGGARYFTLRRSNGGQVTFDNAHPTGHNDHRAPTHSFTQTGSEYYALFNNGAVKLYHPGSDGGILSQKFETIGLGVTVTGTTFTNQLSVSGVTTSQVISVNNLVERGAISFTGIGTTVRTLHTGLSTSTYNSVEYTVSAKYRLLPGYLHLTKILVTHDGATTYITEYGTVHSNGPLSTYNVDINAGSIRLLATPVTSDQTDYTISFTAFK